MSATLSPGDQQRLATLGLALEREASDARLVLRDLGDPKSHPLAVDFSSPQILYRLAHGNGKSQPLPKALGVRSAKDAAALMVFDATAGLGVDSFFIAALGCRVRACEREPALYALLLDGLERLRAHEGDEKLTAIAGRMQFMHGDSAAVLRGLSEPERPDVVFLDPMYPEEGRSESALPKKPLQILRRLIGEDRDSDKTFVAARDVARKRVVVKRPLKAPHLGGEPTHTFAGKTARYDMYLVRP